MKKSVLAALVVAGLTMALTLKARADDEKTITGEGRCAKCALKETKECQNAIQVKEGDKTVTYYLVHNDVSKKFHENVCQETKKVKATGTVKEVDGKKQLTPTKIELVKE
jgi:RecG-like helicase